MNEKELTEELEKVKWTFAKSMPTIPHEYTLRKNMPDELFVDMVVAIRALGVVEYFWKKPYTYFYANGYKYWTMGNPLEDTTLINRAKA